MVINSLIVLIFGAIIGVVCALWVVMINDELEPPWSYICAIAIPFLTKPVVMWCGTLAVVPFVKNLTALIFNKFTGITVLEHQRPNLNITGNTLTLPVAASIAVTIYLIGFNASSGNGVKEGMIYYIATLVGAVVSLSENLSNPVVIKAIWHNRADYQESPLYKRSREKSVENDKPSSPKTNGHSLPTPGQRRRARRSRPAGKR